MRCFTVLIACGWLLLMAPKKPDGTFDPTKPLRDWEQVQFFDTANACNGAVSLTLWGDYTDKYSKAVKKYLDEGILRDEAYSKAAIETEPVSREIRERERQLRGMTRCIPSDAINFPLK